MSSPPARRSLEEPSASRLSADDPRREAILAAHRLALAEGRCGYADPATGLFVLTAAALAERRRCCGCGCRHCPYVP
ncbi:MAG: DUF5522 domain-containing protein [bacterium]